MTNEEIARRFNDMASLMEIRGEDPFRIRSYRMAAEAIETWPTEMVADGASVIIASSDKDFMQLVSPRVGLLNPNDKSEAIWTAQQVSAKTGVTPEQIVDWLSLIGDSVDNIPGVTGVGPKTAATFHQKFKIASLDDLKKFAEGGGLEMVDGIGPKTAERIRQSLARLT